MKIVIDGMGGDNAPKAIVEGAVSAIKELPPGTSIAILGDEEAIKRELTAYGKPHPGIEVVGCSEEILNDDSPVKAIKKKKDSSMVKGITMIKKGEGDVFITAGSTGALLAGGILLLGRIRRVDRPTLAALYPVIGHEPSLLADTGANSECKPRNLLEFGIMGSIYMDKVIGRKNPTVGLVNNGTEEGKGTALTKKAFNLLSESGLNFIGNIETRQLQDGVCDVIVTDGFTGNAIVKLTEGMGLMVLRELKSRFLKNTKSKMGALLLKKELQQIKKEFNYAEYGGAPLLGVNGALLKTHGSSDALAVKQTILKSVPYVEENVVETIREAMKGSLDLEDIGD